MNKEAFTIIIPIPNKWLSPNCMIASVGARIAKSKEAKKQRLRVNEKIRSLFANEGVPVWERASVFPVFFYSTKRKRDEDNAIGSLKSAYDGIIDSGLVADDDPEHMTKLPPSFLFDKTFPRVELLIERVR